MSYVADIVLMLGGLNEPSAVEKLTVNEDGWLKLQPVEWTGPGKAMQTDVYIAAANYLDVDGFLARVEALPWEDRESVTLLIKNENDLTPAMWTFEGAHLVKRVEARSE